MKALIIIVLVVIAVVLYETLKQPFNLTDYEKPKRDIEKPSVRVNQKRKKSKSSPKTPKDKAQHPRKYKSLKKKVKK